MNSVESIRRNLKKSVEEFSEILDNIWNTHSKRAHTSLPLVVHVQGVIKQHKMRNIKATGFNVAKYDPLQRSGRLD